MVGLVMKLEQNYQKEDLTNEFVKISSLSLLSISDWINSDISSIYDMYLKDKKLEFEHSLHASNTGTWAVYEADKSFCRKRIEFYKFLNDKLNLNISFERVEKL
jgi:hypothetical protein